MIAFLKGTVAQKISNNINDNRIYLDVSGVGYDICVSAKTQDAIVQDAQATLLIYMHFSQDLVSLFGFLNQQEKSLFLRLISVSRVGPKLAMASLSFLDAQELATAIVISDEKTLAKISGMGKKTAQRVILELKEKIEKEETLNILDSSYYNLQDNNLDNNINSEAASALVALGYDPQSAKKAVMLACNGDCSPESSIQEIIKSALKFLAK